MTEKIKKEESKEKNNWLTWAQNMKITWMLCIENIKDIVSDILNKKK
jgi:hypothetical protein